MTGLDRKKDDEIIEVLRMMAPGTSLREGLDNILLADGCPYCNSDLRRF